MGSPIRFSQVPLFNNGGNLTNQALSATTTKVGARWRAPKSGNIDRISFWVAALSGTPTLRVGIQETVDGLPNGTFIQSATTTPSLNQNRVTIPSCAVTVDNQYATVVEWDSGATSATVRQRNTGSFLASVLSVADLGMSAGTWLAGSGMPMVIAQYTDNDIAYPSALNVETAVNITDSSNPDEYGNKFVPDHSFWCCGAYFALRDTGNANANAKIALFDSSGTELASCTHTEATDSLVTTPQDFYRYWNPVRLIKGQTYYLSIKATGTGQIAIYSISQAYNDLNAAITGGMIRVTRNNLGAWTEDDTQSILLHPLVSDTAQPGTGVPLIGSGGLIGV